MPVQRRCGTSQDRCQDSIEEATMEQEKERGSTRWIQERFKNGISSDLIDQLPKFADGDRINLWDVWTRGQPPRIDEFRASYFVHSKALGPLIDQIFAKYEGIPLQVLIRGQPPRLQMTEIVFQTQGF
jgi:hypothetical protein